MKPAYIWPPEPKYAAPKWGFGHEAASKFFNSTQYGQNTDKKSVKSASHNKAVKRAYDSDLDTKNSVTSKKQRVKQEDRDENEINIECGDEDESEEESRISLPILKKSDDDVEDTKKGSTNTLKQESKESNMCLKNDDDASEDEGGDKSEPLSKGDNAVRDSSETSDFGVESDDEACQNTPTEDKQDTIQKILSKMEATLQEEATNKILKGITGNSYTSICQKLSATLRLSSGRPLSKEELKECLDNIATLQAKYNLLLHPYLRKNIEENYTSYPMTAKEVNDRMEGPEEEKRPWKGEGQGNLPSSGILYRAWDPASRCKMIRSDVGFLAMGCDSDFSTHKGRQDHLQCHSNWGNRRKTPFISTTPSIDLLAQHYIKWFKNRQKQKTTEDMNMIRLTAFNINARRAAGWPILRMLDEIKHYNVMTPAKYTYKMYKDEYLLPFRIRPEEIVGDWHVTDIEAWLRTRDWRGDMNYELWEREVVKPLYAEHERARKAGEDEKTRRRKAGELVQKLMPGAKLTNWYSGVQGVEYA